jgi:hypothetical protein
MREVDGKGRGGEGGRGERRGDGVQGDSETDRDREGNVIATEKAEEVIKGLGNVKEEIWWTETLVGGGCLLGLGKQVETAFNFDNFHH